MSVLTFWTSLLFQLSLYSLHFSTSDGKDVCFGQFKNKKVLIVNIATDSKYIAQVASLEQLYEKYKDSLVVVAFPSNDFSHESRSDNEIKSLLKSNYHVTYLLASRISVAGSDQSSVYKWLCQGSRNGVMDNIIPGDFIKFLLDSQGNLMGTFNSMVDPMSDDVQNAIMQ